MLKKSEQIEQEKLDAARLKRLLNKLVYDMRVLFEQEGVTSNKISILSKRCENLREDRKTVKNYEHNKKEILVNTLLGLGIALGIFAIAIIGEGIMLETLKNQLDIILPRGMMLVGIPVSLVVGSLSYFPAIYKENKNIEEIISFYLESKGLENSKTNRLLCVREITERITSNSAKLLTAEEKQAEILNNKELLRSLMDTITDEIRIIEDQIIVAEMSREDIAFYATPEEMDEFIDIMRRPKEYKYIPARTVYPGTGSPKH